MSQTERTEEQLNRIRDFVIALRSGEYPQVKEQLGLDDEGKKSYCCEGVAAERYGEQLGYAVKWNDYGLTMNGFGEYAPDSFWEAMGLSVGDVIGTTSNFAFVLPDGQDVLDTGASAAGYMNLNDEGFTFPQIADLIEWQFLS
jgi:hypothetical protein